VSATSLDAVADRFLPEPSRIMVVWHRKP
jgi:hypothetical protein